MTFTLTVIGLITYLKPFKKTVFREALYREKVLSQNHTISIKQFVNAHHEYNETSTQGDLILEGIFTLEDKKIMVRICQTLLEV